MSTTQTVPNTAGLLGTLGTMYNLNGVTSGHRGVVSTNNSGSGGVFTAGRAIHPAFFHPLYALNPALFTSSSALRTGTTTQVSSGSTITSTGTKHSAKSFTIDSILGSVSPSATEEKHLRSEVETLLDDNGYNSAAACWAREFSSTQNSASAVTAPGRQLQRYKVAPHITNHPYYSGEQQKTSPSNHTHYKHMDHTHADKSDKRNTILSMTQDWKAGKNKRVRTIFTPEQLDRLEAEFERQQYMVGTERYYLAASLNLTEAQVKVWFQNRRIKWRKTHLEEQQAKLANRMDIYSESSDSEAEAEDNEAPVDVSDGTSPKVIPADETSGNHSVTMTSHHHHAPVSMTTVSSFYSQREESQKREYSSNNNNDKETSLINNQSDTENK